MVPLLRTLKRKRIKTARPKGTRKQATNLGADEKLEWHERQIF